MQRFFAFLRGINVGGHRVKMTDLRGMFEALGFANVETFIASGNLVFDSASPDATMLERQIERQLKQSLSYEVATFLRTPQELAAIAAFQPFPPDTFSAENHTLSIMLTAAAPPSDFHDKLLAFQTAYDSFHVHQREIYWLCRGKTTDSLVDWPRLGKALPMPLTTTRNATTMRKLAAKYAG